MKIARTGIWVVCGLLGCGPRVGGSEGSAGAEAGEAHGSDDLGSDGFDVGWAMGFYYREGGFSGPQLTYMDLRPGGEGVLHRIGCDFSPLEPLAFQWKALSDTELELHPAEDEEFVPSLTGLTESQSLRRETSEGAQLLVAAGGSEGVRFLSGRPCNVQPPKEGCPMPGFTRLDDISICDER